MGQKDIEFAGKLSNWVRHFPEIWQAYQDWLSDIIFSRELLHQRYPHWQAQLIFRWRLFYFGAHVASAITMQVLSKRLTRWFSGQPMEKRKLSSVTQTTTETIAEADRRNRQTALVERYQYIFQRTATLLAVAELTLCTIAACTGILLALYYQPTALGAYQSLATIAHQINSGELVFSLHHVAGNGLIILALVQIVVMFLGRKWSPMWITGWISGILLALTAMGLSWTAVVLTWEQTSFWRFKIELNIIDSIPFIGSTLREILSGGSGISSVTLQHMYTLHGYVLAIATLLLSMTHLAALIWQEQTWKPEENRLSFTKSCQKIAQKENG